MTVALYLTISICNPSRYDTNISRYLFESNKVEINLICPILFGRKQIIWTSIYLSNIRIATHTYSSLPSVAACKSFGNPEISYMTWYDNVNLWNSILYPYFIYSFSYIIIHPRARDMVILYFWKFFRVNIAFPILWTLVKSTLQLKVSVIYTLHTIRII